MKKKSKGGNRKSLKRVGGINKLYKMSQQIKPETKEIVIEQMDLIDTMIQRERALCKLFDEEVDETWINENLKAKDRLQKRLFLYF